MSRSGIRTIGDPVSSANLVLNLALLVTGHSVVAGLEELTDESHSQRRHRRPGRRVDRHRLGEDPPQPEVFEAVANQLQRAFSGIALTPVPADQPEAQVGFALYLRLTSPVRR